MAQRCTICAHPHLEEINAALVSGTSLRKIAQQFSVSYHALYRHKQTHLPATLVKATEVLTITHADSLMDDLRILKAEALNLLDEAKRSGDIRTAGMMIGQARQVIETLYDVRVEFEKGRQDVNVQFIPIWMELRPVILNALNDYPDAKIAVVEALKGINQ